MKTHDFNFLTSNDKAKDLEVYKEISSLLSKMVSSGILSLGAGHCISVSDMIRTALSHRGIKSKLVEVKTTISDFHSFPPDVKFVGYEEIKNPGEIDSHVVVVTETTPCFLIDASIPHLLPQGVFAVVESIDVKQGLELINSKFKAHQLAISYIQKEQQKIPYVHGDSIINRIETDKRIFKGLGWLKVIVIVALTISTLNFIRGTYDFYLTYIVTDNYWGPTHMKDIHERVERIEKKLEQPKK